eukprot:10537782-Alexandrium_andersonii.AAC.1
MEPSKRDQAFNFPRRTSAVDFRPVFDSASAEVRPLLFAQVAQCLRARACMPCSRLLCRTKGGGAPRIAL